MIITALNPRLAYGITLFVDAKVIRVARSEQHQVAALYGGQNAVNHCPAAAFSLQAQKIIIDTVTARHMEWLAVDGKSGG
ncbi:hypothetical protein D3C81_2194700 [compost metagenome]